MIQRLGSEPLTVDESIVMWHVVLRISHQMTAQSVAITNNPIEFNAQQYYAQIVMHKTRSVDCAKQVARYVRRAFDKTGMVPVVKNARAIEARLGYICQGGYQHAPNPDSESYKIVVHISETPIADLLKENEHNTPDASRSRYVVYEVRSNGRVLRGITNKMHAVERDWRHCPPEELFHHVLDVVGSFPTREAAEARMNECERITDIVFPRHPPASYMRRILKMDGPHIKWVSDGTDAVENYDTPSVVLMGSRVYTYLQITTLLTTGEWVDHRKGLRHRYG